MKHVEKYTKKTKSKYMMHKIEEEKDEQNNTDSSEDEEDHKKPHSGSATKQK